MAKNSKKTIAISVGVVACAALICGIGVQFIGHDDASPIGVDDEKHSALNVSISTTAPIAPPVSTTPTVVIGDNESEGNSTDTTRLPVSDDPADTDTNSGNNGNSGGTSGSGGSNAAISTAAYEPKETIIIVQDFEEATKPATEPPAPEIEDEAMLTDMDKEPEYSPEQIVITTAPQSKPKNGETSGNQIYIDGFGWILNEGGGGEGYQDSEMYMNGNKIGYFG